ncbi:unnamed protein product [Ranitomeya imitator]|uniref:Uncharacterized protein n=1 Tax=Ranitomeya imitator TaxID=111125 RepID=A0ABN9MJD4_9NEOB|nr:unnamed protein product [Ranitomeya imitator]
MWTGPCSRHTGHRATSSLHLCRCYNVESNIRRAVNRGYVCALLQFYQDWHSSDFANHYVPIRRGLLRCLKHITNVRSGREAFHQANGMEILYTTAQESLHCKNLDYLVTAAIQVLRKCFPKCILPLSSISSSYTYLVPGMDKPVSAKICSQEDESEDEDEDMDKNLTNDEKDEDDDLETDLKKLRSQPQPDRPVEDFKQYKAFCSELFDFKAHQGLSKRDMASDLNSRQFYIEKDNASNMEEMMNAKESISGVVTHNIPSSGRCMDDSFTTVDRPTSGDTIFPKTLMEQNILNTISKRSPLLDASMNKQEQMNMEKHLRSPSSICSPNTVCGKPSSFPTKCIKTFKLQHSDGADESESHKVVKQLLEQHKGNIPFHNPHVYMSIAGNTKSVPDFKVLAFPEFWGHCSPQFSQKLAEKKLGSQRSPICESGERTAGAPRTLLAASAARHETPARR